MKAPEPTPESLEKAREACEAEDWHEGDGCHVCFVLAVVRDEAVREERARCEAEHLGTDADGSPGGLNES